MIRQRYNELRLTRVFSFLYRPVDIHYVKFGLLPGTQYVSIHEHPNAMPGTYEVSNELYHYHECPLEPPPSMPAPTFYQYFRGHMPISSQCALNSKVFCRRLPKKLGLSLTSEGTPNQLIFGWGIHIIEGPNKVVLSLLAAAIFVASLVTSIVYDVVMHNSDSGFAIGQWMVAVLTTLLAATYFHFQEQ